MTDISNKDKLENRIYPAIKACISNRYKIVAGIFAVYAFISSSLNKNKEIINQDVSLFAAWIFTFFIVHNAFNYFLNAWEQFDLEKSSNNGISCCKRIWKFLRVEGFFTIAMLFIVWLGYHYILKKLYLKT